MQAPPRPRRRLPVHAADLQGLSRLTVDATLGVVDLVEAMHHTILRLPGPVGPAPQGRAPGLTGLVYGAVRGGARLAGRGVDVLLGAAARQLPGADSPPARDAALAALNGVWGDHLEASANPLAIPMRLRADGVPLVLERQALAARFPGAGARLLVLVHGLCMNDRQWLRDGHDHGRTLADALDALPLYLHYNSGRHISTNGREFAALLEQLVQQWPQPVTELILVGHSMGGLVARSACHVAQQQGMAWPRAVRAMAFLGTPHHGAPLERGGRLVDGLLGISPYAAPFARVGKARSAGITDLRYGNLQDGDWQHRSRHDQRHDDRLPTPLPAGVEVCLVAATTRQRSGHPARRALKPVRAKPSAEARSIQAWKLRIADDALAGRVQLGRDDDDLVGVVERFLVQHGAEALLEVRLQAAVLREAAVDLHDAVGRQPGHPRGVVQRLRHDLARRAVALQLDQHQGAIGRDGQQVDAAPVAGDLLTADQHPFAGQDARLAHDHLFQLLFADELAGGQERRLGADPPDGVLDGHGQQVLGHTGCGGGRAVRRRESKRSAKSLIFNTFQPPASLLSSRGDNKVTGCSAALGLV